MTDDAISKRIKVCFVMPKAYPLFNPDAEGVFGGAEVDLYLLAGELAKDASFTVSFVTADYGQDHIENIEGVEIIKSLDFKKNHISGAIKVWKAMNIADADIYMIETASMGAALVAAYCKLKKKAFVYRTASSRESDGQYIKSSFLLGKAFKYTLKKAKAVICQNVADVRNLKRTAGVDSTVIPNGHHLTELLSNERKFILWVGRSDEVKKPEKFLSLANSFPDEKFVMVCPHATGDDRYEQLYAESEKIGNLIFHKQVPFAKIDQFFNSAMLLVNTSDSEGFANAFLQAFKAGAAVLSLKVNPDGILDEYGCGKCCGGDYQRMIDGLREMLQNNRYLEMGRNGRKYVEEKHDINILIASYKAVFRKIT